MNWEQKMEALQGLHWDISIRMRSPGDWYVDQTGVAIKTGSFLGGGCGNGSTPEEAVNDHWKQKVDDLKSDQYLVTDSGNDKRRAVKWNGFMWKQVVEDIKHVTSTPKG